MSNDVCIGLSDATVTQMDTLISNNGVFHADYATQNTASEENKLHTKYGRNLRTMVKEVHLEKNTSNKNLTEDNCGPKCLYIH